MNNNCISNFQKNEEQSLALSLDAAILLQRLLLTISMASTIIIGWFVWTQRSDLTIFSNLIGVNLVAFVSYRKMKLGQVNSALKILCWGFWVVANVGSFLLNGIRTPVIFFIPVLIMMAVWVQGRRYALLMSGATILNFVALTVAEYQRWLPVPVLRTSIDLLIAYSAVIGLTVAVALTMDEAMQRQLKNEKALVNDLKVLNTSLESRIEERTLKLAAAKEIAESANRAKSVFLANMSHELRTPLNAILGFAKLLERDKELSQESRKKMATINRSGQHLLALINDVLEISRIEANRVIVQNQAFDLMDMLSGIEEMIGGRADEKGLAFLIEHDADLPMYVVGDGPCLKQILINLLSNAVKYTQLGQVHFRVARVDHNNGNIRFVVADTGRGISAEEQDKLFETFYQTEAAITQGEGTGLGLAISKQYTNMMGGRLEVQSETGQGSVFTLIMPMPETQNNAVSTSSVQTVLGLEAGQETMRILVVDDKEDNRELLRLLLEATDFEVRTANDGQQALDAFQSWQPNLIWMDMRMPIMDGYEATRKIRGMPGGSLVKIVALTASAFEEDHAAIMAAGCDGMVSKPVEEQRLFATMGELLGVRYRYVELVASNSLATQVEFDLAPLSLEMQLKLRGAAEALDFAAIELLVTRIGEKYPKLASLIDDLLQGFHFYRIVEVCKASDKNN